MKKGKRIMISAFVALGALAGWVQAADHAEGTVQNVLQVSGETDQNAIQSVTGAQINGGNSAFWTALGVPETFTGDWTGVADLITVHADAELILPQTDTVPTAGIERRSFTQEDVDRMLKVFLLGNPFYKEPEMTKQQIARKLEEYRAMERGEIPLTGDTTLEKIPGLIEYYTELEKTAPNEGERILASQEFESDGIMEIVNGYGEVDGQNVHLFIQNNSLSWDQAICYAEGYGNLMTAYVFEELPDSVTVELSEADARKIGDALMESLGLEQVICDRITPVAYAECETQQDGQVVQSPPTSFSPVKDTGYELQYVRTVDGLPIHYTGYIGNALPENEPEAGIWVNEVITVYVNAEGVVYFHWMSPHTDPVIEEQEVQLLGFDDIGEIFGKMVMVKNSYLEKANEINGMQSTKAISIDRVELNLMRIRNKNDLSQGRIVPVWDFWGTSVFSADGEAAGNEKYQLVLTLNAIDGTMVDRELGY